MILELPPWLIWVKPHEWRFPFPPIYLVHLGNQDFVVTLLLKVLVPEREITRLLYGFCSFQLQEKCFLLNLYQSRYQTQSRCDPAVSCMNGKILLPESTCLILESLHRVLFNLPFHIWSLKIIIFSRIQPFQNEKCYTEICKHVTGCGYKSNWEIHEKPLMRKPTSQFRFEPSIFWVEF